MSSRKRKSSAAEQDKHAGAYPARKRVRRSGALTRSAAAAATGTEKKRTPLKTMMQLHRCSASIENALRQYFVPIAVFVSGDCDEYDHYKADQSSHHHQTTLLLQRGSLSFHRSPDSTKNGSKTTKSEQCHAIETFDDDSLEIQAAIEFGLFRHRAQLARSQHCDLVYSTIAADARSVYNFWNCLRTGARLRCRLLMIDVQRPGKKTISALDQATHSLNSVGYTCRIVDLASRRRLLLLAVPIEEHDAEQRLLDLDSLQRQKKEQRKQNQNTLTERSRRAGSDRLPSMSSQSTKIVQLMKAILKPTARPEQC